MVKRHRVLRVPSGGISMLVFFLVAVQDSLSSPPFQEKYKVSLSLIPQNLRPPFFESRGSSQMEYKISLSVPLDGQRKYIYKYKPVKSGEVPDKRMALLLPLFFIYSTAAVMLYCHILRRSVVS